MEIILTQHGRKLLNKGKLIAKYYKFFDDEVDYQATPGDDWENDPLHIESPSDILQLHSWWHADLGVTLDPTYVSAWADQSANANDLSQATAGNRPLLSSLTVSGKSALHFATARSDFLADAALATLGSTTPAFTFFAAFEMGAVNNAFRELMQLGSGGTWVMRTNNNAKWNMLVDGITDVAAECATTESTGNLVRLIASYSGGSNGTVSITRNGAAPVLGSSTSAAVISATPECRIGGRSGGFGVTDAKVRTCGIYNRVLTATEIMQLDDYLERQL